MAVTSLFKDAQSAFSKGQSAPTTYESTAELCVLQLHSQFETFVEELFLSCLLGESGIEVDRLISPAGRDHAYSLLVRGQGRETDYLTWLPFQITLERAEKLFAFGRPLARITCRPPVLDGLRELMIVRNSVAHPSQLAFRRLKKLAESRSYTISRSSDFLLAVRHGRTELEQFHRSAYSGRQSTFGTHRERGCHNPGSLECSPLTLVRRECHRARTSAITAIARSWPMFPRPSLSARALPRQRDHVPPAVRLPRVECAQSH